MYSFLILFFFFGFGLIFIQYHLDHSQHPIEYAQEQTPLFASALLRVGYVLFFAFSTHQHTGIILLITIVTGTAACFFFRKIFFEKSKNYKKITYNGWSPKIPGSLIIKSFSW